MQLDVFNIPRNALFRRVVVALFYALCSEAGISLLIVVVSSFWIYRCPFLLIRVAQAKPSRLHIFEQFFCQGLSIPFCISRLLVIAIGIACYISRLSSRL